jgi:hypothetical protein
VPGAAPRWVGTPWMSRLGLVGVFACISNGCVREKAHDAAGKTQLMALVWERELIRDLGITTPGSLLVSAPCHVWVTDAATPRVSLVSCVDGQVDSTRHRTPASAIVREFRLTTRWMGDTVAIWDGIAERFALFTAHGEFAGFHPIHVDPDAHGFPRAVAWDSTRDLFLLTERFAIENTGVSRSTLLRWRIDRDALLSGVALGAGGRALNIVTSDWTASFPMPFAGAAAFVPMADGSVLYGNTALPELWSSLANERVNLRLADALGGDVTLGASVAPFKDSLLRALRTPFKGSVGPRSTRQRAIVDSILTRIRLPQHRALFSHASANEVGHIYLALADRPGRWAVLDPRTASLTLLQTPAAGRLRFAGVNGSDLFTIEQPDGRRAVLRKYSPQGIVRIRRPSLRSGMTATRESSRRLVPVQAIGDASIRPTSPRTPSTADGNSAAPLQASREMTPVWSTAFGDTLFVNAYSIALAGSCSVWVVARNGVFRTPCERNHFSIVGRFGGGPGEYRAPSALSVPGRDTVLVWDNQLQRVSVHAADGSFITNWALTWPHATLGFVMGIDTPIRGGPLRVWSVKDSSVVSGPTASVVVQMDAGGRVRDTVALYPGPQSIVYSAAVGTGRLDAPFRRRPFVLFQRDGGFVAGDTRTPALVAHDPSGQKRVQDLSLPPASPVTADDRRAYVDSVLTAARHNMDELQYGQTLKARFAEAIQDVLSRVAYPATRQTYDLIALDPDANHVWVLLPAWGASYRRTWKVFRMADGSEVRSVSVSHQGAVWAAAVRGTSLYAIERSRDMDTRLARYDLVRQ